MGPPAAICSLKVKTTLPVLPSTLPNLTVIKGRPLSIAVRCTNNYATFLLAPIILVGFTTLSVEIMINWLIPVDKLACNRFRVPITLLIMASVGLSSIKGTCLWAAAWKTMSGRYFSKIDSIRYGETDIGDYGNNTALMIKSLVTPKMLVDLKNSIFFHVLKLSIPRDRS